VQVGGVDQWLARRFSGWMTFPDLYAYM